jgi:hypothetical protein
MTEITLARESIAAAIDAAHEAKAGKPRPHLGASAAGHHCDRWLWLSFRWAVQPQFDGRMLRLFRRGHREEANVIEDLRAIGCVITHTGYDQARVQFGCHVSGSMDGIIESGLPGAEKTRHLLEIKTHGRKSFDALEKDGVEKSKPEHWAQMQVYMLGAGMDRALYAAVCKDDDRYHFERVRLDRQAAEQLVDRARRIALSERMPEPCAGGAPDWYLCKFCPAHEFCWETRKTKHVNCRTCAHVTPLEDSTWHCARHDAGGIPTDYQREGCPSHVLHPDLVPWQIADSPNQWEAVYIIDGVPVRNGEGDANVYSSREILERT